MDSKQDLPEPLSPEDVECCLTPSEAIPKSKLGFRLGLAWAEESPTDGKWCTRGSLAVTPAAPGKFPPNEPVAAFHKASTSALGSSRKNCGDSWRTSKAVRQIQRRDQACHGRNAEGNRHFAKLALPNSQQESIGKMVCRSKLGQLLIV